MKKRFAQHLLVDKNYLNKIINSISLNPSDIVVEIGAGSGNLTKLLSERVKKVYAVEIERDILKELQNNVRNLSNVEIINKDFLKLDLIKLIEKNMHSALKVVGNIPYQITSKILLKLFGEIDSPAPHLKYLQDVYLMLQLEVANRVVGLPGTKDYSPLSILVQYFSVPQILFTVPNFAFYPKPKVDSAFVSFDIKKEPPKVKSPSFLRKIVRTSFQQRRKKLINSLSKLVENKSTLEKMLNDLEIGNNLRPENLSINDFIKIADSF